METFLVVFKNCAVSYLIYSKAIEHKQKSFVLTRQQLSFVHTVPNPTFYSKNYVLWTIDGSEFNFSFLNPIWQKKWILNSFVTNDFIFDKIRVLQ